MTDQSRAREKATATGYPAETRAYNQEVPLKPQAAQLMEPFGWLADWKRALATGAHRRKR